MKRDRPQIAIRPITPPNPLGAIDLDRSSILAV
jgi:hypothetical protein